MLQKIKESVDYIIRQYPVTPKIGLILGSGLGSFSKSIQIECSIPFSVIPNFPVSGIDGHAGALLLGKSGAKEIVIMQGRVHFYEGYSMDEITFPVRLMKALGIEALFITNAAGGMNPAYSIGDLMLISDHINMMPNPLVGTNIDSLGPRFPDMSEAYDKVLLELGIKMADDLQINLHQGVYVAVTGPSYETPAEYKFFRIIGGDAVGMSTVPEVIVARHMGLRCFALSVITDLGVEGRIEYISHDMVKVAAGEAEPQMTSLLKALIEKL